MRGTAGWGFLALVAACSAEVGGANPDNPDGGGGDDGDIAVPIDAEILGAFGTPAKITTAADDDLNEDDGSLSYSGLELVFAVQNEDDNNRKDLFYASRQTTTSAFGPAMLLPFSATGTAEETPRFSTDDLALFFAKTNGATNLDIFKVTRPSAGSTQWGMPQLVQGVSSGGVDKWFMPCANDRYLMIVGADIAEGTLGGGPPVIVAELSSPQSETGTFLTQDCLTTHFASQRDGTNRIYTSTRPSVAAPWSAPTIVDFFAVLGGNQQDPFIATDTRTFVFASDADGSNDMYLSTR